MSELSIINPCLLVKDHVTQYGRPKSGVIYVSVGLANLMAEHFKRLMNLEKFSDKMINAIMEYAGYPLVVDTTLAGVAVQTDQVRISCLEMEREVVAEQDWTHPETTDVDDMEDKMLIDQYLEGNTDGLTAEEFKREYLGDFYPNHPDPECGACNGTGIDEMGRTCVCVDDRWED